MLLLPLTKLALALAVGGQAMPRLKLDIHTHEGLLHLRLTMAPSDIGLQQTKAFNAELEALRARLVRLYGHRAHLLLEPSDAFIAWLHLPFEHISLRDDLP
jgi:hypothetical protein